MTYETIKRNYDRKLWSAVMVKTAVVKGVITAAQFYEITGDKAILKTLVVSNNITAEEYKTITGDDYVA